MLQYVHPDHTSPDVCNVVELAELLRIADQYQMATITDHLRRCLTSVSLRRGVYSEPITVRQPLAAFAVAISFGFLEEARYALREVITCDIRQELGEAGEYKISLYYMQYILELRARRAEWFMGKIRILTKHVRQYCNAKITNYLTNGRGKDMNGTYSLILRAVTMEHALSTSLAARPSLFTWKQQLANPNHDNVIKHLKKVQPKLFHETIARCEAEAAVLEAKLPRLTRDEV